MKLFGWLLLAASVVSAILWGTAMITDNGFTLRVIALFIATAFCAVASDALLVRASKKNSAIQP